MGMSSQRILRHEESPLNHRARALVLILIGLFGCSLVVLSISRDEPTYNGWVLATPDPLRTATPIPSATPYPTLTIDPLATLESIAITATSIVHRATIIAGNVTPAPFQVAVWVGPTAENANIANDQILITNRGRESLNLAGWTISDEDGYTIALPNMMLSPGQQLEIYTREGQTTADEIYLGLEGAVWDVGEQVILRRRSDERDQDNRANPVVPVTVNMGFSD
jgi:hypothetical protein